MIQENNRVNQVRQTGRSVDSQQNVNEDFQGNYEESYQGLSSLLSTQKVSTMYTPFGNTFLETLGGIQVSSTQFFYASNIVDLWRYLEFQLKSFNAHFDDQELSIIRRSILFSRNRIKNSLISDCKKINVGKHKILQAETVIQKTKKTTFKIGLQQFKESSFYQNCLQIKNKDFQMGFEKFYQSFYNLEFEQIDAQLLKIYQEELLKFIYTKIREKNVLKTKRAISLYLNIIYLRMATKNRSWFKIVTSRIPISTMYIRLLAVSNGSIKLIRFFEDASSEVVSHEYEKTKHELYKLVK